MASVRFSGVMIRGTVNHAGVGAFRIFLKDITAHRA